jgi:hypothetical protein
MMSAPRETRCRSMSTMSIIGKTTASVSGMAMATTVPARAPRATKLITSTMPIACHSEVVNSLIARSTVRG